jgi:hypothetical protein
MGVLSELVARVLQVAKQCLSKGRTTSWFQEAGCVRSRHTSSVSSKAPYVGLTFDTFLYNGVCYFSFCVTAVVIYEGHVEEERTLWPRKVVPHAGTLTFLVLKDGHLTTERLGSSSNALDLDSWCTWFESRQTHRLSWLKFFVEFLSYSRQTSG